MRSIHVLSHRFFFQTQNPGRVFPQVKSQFGTKMFATNVVVLVPVPEHTSRATILVTAGKAKYDGVRKALVWKVCCYKHC